MRFGFFALSVVPTAWAAAVVYNVPQTLALKAADTDDDCVLPNDYHVLDFKSSSQDAGKTLSAFNFTFTDDSTVITTDCYFNSTSEPAPSNGKPTARYLCNDKKIEFIWENESRKLWMIQQVCPGSDGAADYEVSGSAPISYMCPKAIGDCVANQTDYKALFTSLDPIKVGGGGGSGPVGPTGPSR